jgi:hypothetical protein
VGAEFLQCWEKREALVFRAREATGNWPLDPFAAAQRGGSNVPVASCRYIRWVLLPLRFAGDVGERSDILLLPEKPLST